MGNARSQDEEAQGDGGRPRREGSGLWGDPKLKLVFIYGPPAVGKLTVAREVAKLTGFRLFHNHVAIDFARSVFEFGTPSFWRVVDGTRRDMLEEVAKSGTDAIFTFVYGGETDDAFIRWVTGVVEAQGGEVCFVRLRCDRAEVLRRVAGKKRKRMGKLASRKGLSGLYSRYDLDARIPSAESFDVDTGETRPREAARQIAARCRIPRV